MRTVVRWLVCGLHAAREAITTYWFVNIKTLNFFFFFFTNFYNLQNFKTVTGTIPATCLPYDAHDWWTASETKTVLVTNDDAGSFDINTDNSNDQNVSVTVWQWRYEVSRHVWKASGLVEITVDHLRYAHPLRLLCLLPFFFDEIKLNNIHSRS